MGHNITYYYCTRVKHVQFSQKCKYNIFKCPYDARVLLRECIYIYNINYTHAVTYNTPGVLLFLEQSDLISCVHKKFLNNASLIRLRVRVWITTTTFTSRGRHTLVCFLRVTHSTTNPHNPFCVVTIPNNK